MKLYFKIVFCSLLTFFLYSCSGGIDKSTYDRVVEERDSILKIASSHSDELDGLNAYLDDIASCIDSISYQEKNVLVRIDQETGKTLTRNEIRERVKDFGEMIARQRQRLAQLNDSLSKTDKSNINTEEIKRLSSLITFLNSQLEAKEAEINNLKAELASSKRSIAELTDNVNTLQTANNTLANENKTLDNTVVAQQEKLNEGYLLVRTKKELEEMGILKSGFLQKTKFNAGNVDISQCQKVDIRHFNEMTIPSGKPKLLSQAPANSYTFEKIDKKSSKFIILDTSAFWTISKVVIIQL